MFADGEMVIFGGFEAYLCASAKASIEAQKKEVAESLEVKEVMC